MPHLLDTGNRTDLLQAAINDLLVDTGAAALSMRTIARACRLSTSSMHHHYGDRERLLRVVCSRTMRAWIDDIERRSAWDGLDAFLPSDEAGVRATTAVLAWWEYGRTRPGLSGTVAEAQLDQRALLGSTLGPATSPATLEGAIALVRGLTMAACNGRPPLALDTAHELLHMHLPPSARWADRRFDEVTS